MFTRGVKLEAVRLIKLPLRVGYERLECFATIFGWLTRTRVGAAEVTRTRRDGSCPLRGKWVELMMPRRAGTGFPVGGSCGLH